MTESPSKNREATPCPGCGKATRTIFGKCPNCGGMKEPTAMPAAESYRPPLLGFDEDDLFLGPVWWVPVPVGIVLLVIGLVLGSVGLIAGGGGLAVLALAGVVLR